MLAGRQHNAVSVGEGAGSTSSHNSRIQSEAMEYGKYNASYSNDTRSGEPSALSGLLRQILVASGFGESTPREVHWLVMRDDVVHMHEQREVFQADKSMCGTNA